MEVPSFSSPRGKRGEFTKGRAQKDGSSTPNLLLALATVALATGAGASTDSHTGCWGAAGDGYEQRWPETWEA